MKARRGAAVLVLAGLVLLATPLAVWGQAAGDREPSFTGFSLNADASGMSMVFGDPSAQPYPLGTGIVPSTLATLNTGPSGFAQASAAWPGPLASNAGSLAATLLPLCDPTGAGICTPKPDGATLALANYPVRAEASSPAGESDSAQGPLYAHAKGNSSSANATITDFASAGLVSSARVSSVSRTLVEESTATTFAETVISGISAAGGAIKIDSIRTLAKVVTDGVKSTKTRQITVSGLEVGGQKATVDESGVHFGGQGADNPLTPAVDVANAQIASNFGIEMFLTKPLSNTDKDGTVRLNTGALGIIWKIPGSTYQMIVSLGGAGIVSQASAGIPLDVPGLSGDTGLAVPPLDGGGGAVGSVGGGALATGAGGEALSSGGTGTTSGSSNAGGTTTLAAEPAAGHVGFGGIALILVLAALVGAVLAGVGLGRLQLLALEPKGGAACQNGGRR